MSFKPRKTIIKMEKLVKTNYLMNKYIIKNIVCYLVSDDHNIFLYRFHMVKLNPARVI